MAGKAKLPMEIENFMEMRTGGFYYVDKTGLIKTLLENPVGNRGACMDAFHQVTRDGGDTYARIFNKRHDKGRT